MGKLTLEFLVMGEEFQDAITYTVDPNFTFLQVIDHVCSSFGFDQDSVIVRSSLGQEIAHPEDEITKIVDKHGNYFKIVQGRVNETDETEPDDLADDLVKEIDYEIDLDDEEELQDLDLELDTEAPEVEIPQHDLEDMSNQATTEEAKGPEDTTEHQISTQSDEDNSYQDEYRQYDDREDSEIFHDVLDDLMMINYDNWEIDDEGMVEITFVPRINRIVTELKIKYHNQGKLRDLFSEIARICRIPLKEIIFTPMREDSKVIDDYEQTLEELVSGTGAVFIIYPNDMREEIENQTELMARKVRELIYKYKK